MKALDIQKLIAARQVEADKDVRNLAVHRERLGRWSEASVSEAKRVIGLWRARNLCSVDYIDEWESLIEKDSQAIADVACADNCHAQVLRRNSPILLSRPIAQEVFA